MGSITSHMTFGRRSTNYFFLSFFLFSTFLLFPPHCESESLRPISFENWIRDGGFWCVFPFTHINGKWRECRKRQVMRRRAHWRMCHFFWQKFFSILFGNNDTYITAYGNYLVSEVTKLRFWFYSSLSLCPVCHFDKKQKVFYFDFFLSPRVYFSADVVCVNDVGAALPFSCPFISPQITLYNFDHKKKHIFYIFFLALEYSVLVQPIRRVSVSLFPDGCNTIRANSDTLSDTWIHKPHHPLKNLGGALCLVVLEFPFYLVST